jgi:hypothetical protein
MLLVLGYSLEHKGGIGMNSKARSLDTGFI